MSHPEQEDLEGQREEGKREIGFVTQWGTEEVLTVC